MSWTNPYAVSTSDVNLVEAKEFLDHYSPSSLPFASETDFHSTREAIQKADTLCDEVKALLPEGKYCLADDPVHVLRAANNEVLTYRSTVGNAKSSDVGDQESRDVLKHKVNELHGVIHTARLAHAFDERKRKLTWVAVVEAAEEYVLTFADLMNVPIEANTGCVQAPTDSNADTEMFLDSEYPAAEASESDAQVEDLSMVHLPLSAMAQTILPSTTPSSEP